jgi:hypothetical protein
MKNIDLSQVISTVANVGVIAGIVFLAFELRQNNELLISQARSNLVYGRATYQEYLAINAGGIAEIVTKVRQSELSDTERFQLNVHWDLVINNWASMYQEVASGPLDEADLPRGSWARVFRSNPDLRKAWEVRKVDHPAEFVRFIDGLVLAQ